MKFHPNDYLLHRAGYVGRITQITSTQSTIIAVRWSRLTYEHMYAKDDFESLVAIKVIMLYLPIVETV